MVIGRILVPMTLTLGVMTEYVTYFSDGIKATNKVTSGKAMAPQSSTLAWKIPWMETPLMALITISLQCWVGSRLQRTEEPTKSQEKESAIFFFLEVW